jgi:hypothetical protein
MAERLYSEHRQCVANCGQENRWNHGQPLSQYWSRHTNGDTRHQTVTNGWSRTLLCCIVWH